MGKIKQGILGGFKGKVGTVIGSSWNGIAYMRGLAQSVKNPKTAGQQTQRGFFKELMDLVGQLSTEQLHFLFPSAPSGMTRRNQLVRQLAAVAVVDGDTKSVDLANINSIGNAPTAELPAVTFDGDAENITILWSEENDIRTAAADEYPTFFMANVTKKKVFLINSTTALGASGEVSVRIPVAAYGEDGDTFSGFMMLTGSTTAPVGFGTLAVTKRPARTKKHD